RVWRGYLALARATAAYDRLLYQRYGESTPWELPWEDVPPGTVTPAEPVTSADPYPQVVTVRHQRDYRVPSVSALLAVARRAGQRSRWERGTPEPDTVGAAVLELVMDGDGSLGSLDLPELEPLGGLVTVAERSAAGTGERLLARLEERPGPPLAPGAADGGPEPAEPGGGRASARRRSQYERPGRGAAVRRRRNRTWRVPSRYIRTRPSSHPANSAWMLSCAAALVRSTLAGSRS